MSERLPADSQISHYRILAKIGEGGMGEVYLAQDTKLDRKVALKILPADFGADDSRMSRFIREAKSVSALNHPNILTIHEIGEDSSQHYIATEFIAGKTLRELMQVGPLPLLQSVEIACQIGAALNAAHQTGIIHRDIKPENVMVRADGLVKVLDFGLAKLTGGSSDPDSETRIQSETQPGMIIGTVAYMSPQQARGKAVDACTDIWSLGVVIYEMLSGRQPFRGETMTDTLANILHQDPEPLNIEPPDLAQIVRKMLGKKLEARYATINDVVGELKYLQRRIEFERELDRKSPLNKRTEERTVMIPSTTTPEPISSAPIDSGSARTDEGFWIAVLPFKYRGSNADLEALAEGLSEDIVTGLSRFSYLKVIARPSTLGSTESSDIRSIGKQLGARYVMEGSLRQAGSVLRVTVQLIDTSTGAHLWAENYERSFSPEKIFELQDDLVPRVVSTVADQYGALVHSMSESLRGRSAGQYSAHEAVLRAFGYWERMTPEEHAEVRDILEAAVAMAPDHSDCLAELASIYWHEYAFGYNLKPDPVGRARAAAQRAVAAAPTSHFAHCALATSLFFQKDYLAFRPAAERALALNRMDSSTAAILGNMIAYAGDWEYGLGIVERAMQLNPHHAGWYHYVAFCDAYRKHDYHSALSIALKVNMPAYHWPHVYLAAVYGQLVEQQRATAALRELHALVPNFGAIAREEFGKWLDQELTEHLLEGLRKAGLEIAGVTGGNGDGETGGRGDAVKVRDVTPSPHLPVTPSSSGSLFKSIAVLPFQNLSVDPEQEFFADGITEEILNALAQIKELRVAGRSSSFSFKGRNEDLRSVGAKLNVTSILEGTLRRSGDRLRITAQLIDAVSGYQLWSERYDRVLENIFDVQDEIALAVVDALKLKLFGDAKEVVVKRYTDDVEVHELFLKGRYYSYKYTAEGWTRAVEFFEKVIEKHPDHAPAHAGKAAALGCLWFFGLSPAAETVPRFRSAATVAIELDGNSGSAHLSLGMVNFFHDWEWEKAEQEFKQAILLNPKDAEALSYYAMFLGFVDRFDEAMALARRALEVDPLSLLINMNVGWTYFSAGLANEAIHQARKMTEIEPGFFGAYWLKGATCLENGDYEEAIEQLTKAVSLGGYPIVLADLGAANALAGKKETAETILDQLLEMRRQSYVPAICLARVYSRLGELEKTIQWLESAFEERNGELVFLESEITSAAQGDSLHSLGKDPRVKNLLARMKLPSREASRDRENK